MVLAWVAIRLHQAPMLSTNPLRHEFRIEFEFDETELGCPIPSGLCGLTAQPCRHLVSKLSPRAGSNLYPIRSRDLVISARMAAPWMMCSSVLWARIELPVTVIGGFRGDLTSPPEIEIDHVQYGLTVPEPSTIALAVSFLAFFLKFYF